MKFSFFTVFFFFITLVFSQEKEEGDRYYFQVNIAKPETLSVIAKEDGTYKINSNNPKETEIYSQHRVYEFISAYPASSSPLLKNVYNIVTDRVELIGALWYNFPEKYSRIDQFYPDEAPFYPNDYGSTSPVENLGTSHPLYDLDHINAPGAWGITKGSAKVVIGISDSKIDSTNMDMKGRVTNYIKYFDSAHGMICAHGTNVAGIAIARMDNGYGRPGVCSECTVVTNGYGSFKHIEELVAAGAKVINTSWAMCTMGSYHENIETRINEMYEDSIIIVAGAGNAKNCNRDDDYAPDDYAYPASFEKVISVTGVYSQYDTPEENTFIGKENKPAASLLKDRHSKEYEILKDGTLHPKYRKWDMQFNESIDLVAPAQSYLLGHDYCGLEVTYGGASSNSAPYITGVIGLLWSVNYCLSAYEVETILKLTSVEIDHLSGNEYYKMKLGAGRVDAYKAVKMARDMKELMGTVEVSGRDFYRFDFRLEHAPYNILIKDQVFRDSASVNFKARNAIVLKNTILRPDRTAKIKLHIDPSTPIEECLPKPPKKYPSVYPETKTQPRKTEGENIKQFMVVLDATNNGIKIYPKNKKNSKNIGRTYDVTIYSSSNELLQKNSFSYPENGILDLSSVSEKMLTITIVINEKKETHLLKVNF